MSEQTIDSDEEEMQDLLVRYVLGDIEPEARLLMRRLLTTNPALAKEAAELERIIELLPLAMATPAPAHLRDRVLAAAREKQQPHEAARAPSDRARYWRFATITSLAAAAIICALLVVERSGLRHELDLERRASVMLREPNIVMSFRLDGTGSTAAASGVVLLDLDAKRAAIAVDDLPVAPQGYAYHLWAVLESKNVPCGRFNPSANGSILTQFPIPVDSYTSPIQKLILTLEPDRDQAIPKSEAVMTS